MKKLFALLLALVMVMSLAACGGGRTADRSRGSSLRAPVSLRAGVRDLRDPCR